MNVVRRGDSSIPSANAAIEKCGNGNIYIIYKYAIWMFLETPINIQVCHFDATRSGIGDVGKEQPTFKTMDAPIAFFLEGKAMKLKIVLEPSDEGGFTVYVPSLPGFISEGDTKEEAMAKIKEAIELYLEPVEDDLTLSPDHEIMEIAV